MAAEIEEIPAVARRLLAQSGESVADFGARLRMRKPTFVTTVARGSSDHAASFFKYAVEILAGVPVASLGPSLASVYGAPLQLSNAVMLAISQSGASPDLLSMVALAKAKATPLIAIVNDEKSPLANEADWLLPMLAGKERSVAATKTFFASAQLTLMLVAQWSNDQNLLKAIASLPDNVAIALKRDWPTLSAMLCSTQGLYICGRGAAFSIAQEMALKTKETAGIHAEAFSLAEVMHGPARLIGPDFPVLVLLPDDEAKALSMAAIGKLRTMSKRVLVIGSSNTADLPLPLTGHGMTDALLAVVPFYKTIEQVARALGFDPDRPPHLSKVTQTR